MSRTDVALTVMIAAGLLLVPLVSLELHPPVQTRANPPIVRGTTPITHVVVLMQENHAFDNYFGTFPGVDGLPANTSIPDGLGGNVTPYWINGSATPDLPHSRQAELVSYDNGSMDGFARATQLLGPGLERFPMGYYDRRQIPWYWSVASNYTIADHYFQPVFGPTIPNRLYAFAGTSGGLTSNAINGSTLDNETVFDQLQARGISWTYYSSEVLPFLPLPLYLPHIRNSPSMAKRIVPVSQLASDINAGRLAQVVYVDTEYDPFISEHPPESVTIGEEWAEGIVRSVAQSPVWNSTAVFITWDESGGYYDHVPPPQVDTWGYGFRVPLLVISPFAKRGFVDHEIADHASIMRFIADNWALPLLTPRESHAANLFAAFNFTQGPTTGPFGLVVLSRPGVVSMSHSLLGMMVGRNRIAEAWRVEWAG
jgi:phospholipase C